MRRLHRDIALSALVLSILGYCWMFSYVSVPNERSRAYLTRALVDQHTLTIDEPIRRFGPIYDLAQHDGHLFTDKAPGASLLSAPVYAVARLFAPVATDDIHNLIGLLRRCVMLPFGLLGFLLLRSLLRRQGLREPTVDVTSLSYALGSVVLHYSTALYGHVMVATLSLLSLRAWAALGVLGGDREETSRPRLAAALAGVGAGLMGLTEYQAVVASALLLLPLLGLPRARALALVPWFVLGALPSAALLLLYNTLAFGGPFQLSYHHLVGQSLQALHGSGLAGATQPTWQALRGLLVSAHRGLLTGAPLLTLGFASLLWPGTLRLALRSTLALGTLYFLLIVASSSVWFGGWSFGPRLLVPMVPLLTVAAAPLVEKLLARGVSGALVAAATLLGVAQNMLMQITFSEPPPEFLHPLEQIALPMLRHGLVAPNVVCKWLPLGPLNLLPLLALVAACVAWIVLRAVPRGRLRALWSALALTLPCALLGYQLVSTPASPAHVQNEWLGYIALLQHNEASCAAPR